MASKIKYEEVKQDIEKQGWTLKSSSYVNLKTDLEVECPEGHTTFFSYEKWRRGKVECPICKQNNYYKPNEYAKKKKGFRILAFDQATNTSGWAVFDGEELISYGSHTSIGSRDTEKIAQTKYWVASMIEKWQPDLVVIEDIQLQTYKTNDEQTLAAVKTFKILAHLQGVLKNYFFEKEIDFRVVPPATWRMHSKVKGNHRTDQKKSAQLIVKKFYDITVSQDEADAILIGKWGVFNNKVNELIEF